MAAERCLDENVSAPMEHFGTVNSARTKGQYEAPSVTENFCARPAFTLRDKKRPKGNFAPGLFLFFLNQQIHIREKNIMTGLLKLALTNGPLADIVRGTIPSRTDSLISQGNCVIISREPFDVERRSERSPHCHTPYNLAEFIECRPVSRFASFAASTTLSNPKKYPPPAA
jgi:hypothetical protein